MALEKDTQSFWDAVLDVRDAIWGFFDALGDFMADDRVLRCGQALNNVLFFIALTSLFLAAVLTCLIHG